MLWRLIVYLSLTGMLVGCGGEPKGVNLDRDRPRSASDKEKAVSDKDKDKAEKKVEKK